MGEVVTLTDVSKIYKIYQRPRDRFLEAFFSRSRHHRVAALEGITCMLEKGRSLGLIGVNGAGKSTLLKLIAGTTTPSRGTLTVSGRVAAILELGMGFHGDFTGRDNAVLNAAMLGLTEREAMDQLQAMVEFAELGEFIDRPVKTYSSGMAMRLAFAVATHVNPDVLIIDEALAVGDGYFQKKCVDKIREFKERGKTIILCTHALYYVAQLCEEALWLHDGIIRGRGPSRDVVAEYETYLSSRKETLPETPHVDSEALPAVITGIDLGAGADRPVSLDHGSPLSIHVTWKTGDPSLTFRLGVVIDHPAGFPVFAATSPGTFSGSEEYEARCSIGRLPFLKGDYDIVAFLVDDAGLNVFHQVKGERLLRTVGEEYSVGFLQLEHDWS